MRKAQITCSTGCAGRWRSQQEAKDPALKARRRAIMRVAGAASGVLRTARVRAALMVVLEGQTPVEAWHTGYTAGYSAGWFRGAHDRPSSRTLPLVGYERPKDRSA